LPLDLARLNLESPLKVDYGLLELILFRVMHTQAGYHIDLRRVVPVGLLVVVHGLEFILLLLIEVAHLREDLRVAWDLGDQDVVPLERLSTHTDQLVNMSYLIDHLVGVGDYGM